MRSFLILVALTAVGPVRAAPDSAASTFSYLASGRTDVLTLLAAPAAAGSAEDKADLESAYTVSSAATPEQRAEAKDEVKLTIFHFSPVIGSWFQAGKFPKLEALFKEVETETKAVTSKGKKYWQRQRPYVVDPVRFPHAVEHEKATDYSYPSGHSTRGTVYATLLAEIFPEHRDALVARGREIGWRRVQGGVHYPADIYAGRVLGQSLARDFIADPEFQRDLAAAKAELAAAARP